MRSFGYPVGRGWSRSGGITPSEPPPPPPGVKGGAPHILQSNKRQRLRLFLRIPPKVKRGAVDSQAAPQGEFLYVAPNKRQRLRLFLRIPPKVERGARDSQAAQQGKFVLVPGRRRLIRQRPTATIYRVPPVPPAPIVTQKGARQVDVASTRRQRLRLRLRVPPIVRAGATGSQAAQQGKFLFSSPTKRQRLREALRIPPKLERGARESQAAQQGEFLFSARKGRGQLRPRTAPLLHRGHVALPAAPTTKGRKPLISQPQRPGLRRTRQRNRIQPTAYFTPKFVPGFVAHIFDHLEFGSLRAKWLADEPEGKWETADVGSKWKVRKPEPKWETKEPRRKWPGEGVD